MWTPKQGSDAIPRDLDGLDVKWPGQFQLGGRAWIILFWLSLAVAGCSDDEPVEPPPPQQKARKPAQPEVREWYPAPRHTRQQPMMAQPGTVFQPAPLQQQPQVIIVQPAYQPQYGQPLQQPGAWDQPAYTQQYVPQQQFVPQQQYVPQQQFAPQQQFSTQFQYGQRPWGETGSYGQSSTARPAGGGQQQIFSTPYGTAPAPWGGTAYPGWGVSPYGTFPGTPYPGSLW